MASISDLEPEFVEFIQTQNYGTPKAFAKPHDYEDLKAYYEGLSGIRFENIHQLQFLNKCIFADSLEESKNFLAVNTLPETVF